MAEIDVLRVRPVVELTVSITFTEAEIKFLDALIGYGGKELVDRFKETLGKAYIEGAEAAGIAFCDKLRPITSKILDETNKLRQEFQKIRGGVR